MVSNALEVAPNTDSLFFFYRFYFMGDAPYIIHWMYRAIIRPVLTSIILVAFTETKSYVRNLTKVQ